MTAPVAHTHSTGRNKGTNNNKHTNNKENKEESQQKEEVLVDWMCAFIVGALESNLAVCQSTESCFFNRLFLSSAAASDRDVRTIVCYLIISPASINMTIAGHLFPELYPFF